PSGFDQGASMHKTQPTNFIIPLSLALALAACGGSAPDDEPAPAPEAIEPAAGQAPQQPVEADPVPDPDAPLPQAELDEHGMHQPWAIAAQMAGSLQALGEGCGID